MSSENWVKPQDVTGKTVLAWRVFAAERTLPWAYATHYAFATRSLDVRDDKTRSMELLDDFADFVALERLKGNL